MARIFSIQYKASYTSFKDKGEILRPNENDTDICHRCLMETSIFQIGIDPPRGVLMYGPPGCGKTMLAKAVAHHTTASFIRVVGSEFVQKYLGEGPRMVRDVFRLAKENSPAIIFIDEIDAIATKRFDAQTGADREVQRILLELLNQVWRLFLDTCQSNFQTSMKIFECIFMVF